MRALKDVIPPPHPDLQGSIPGAAPRVLMLARDLRSGGGVVNFVAMLMKELQGRVLWTHQVVGRRPGEPAWRTPLRLLADCARLVRALWFGGYAVVHLNPSLIPRALPRDLTFLALAQCFGRARQLVFIHGWDWATYHRIATSPARRAVVSWLLRRASRIVVLSSDFKKALCHIGVPEALITVATTMFHRDAVPAPEELRSRPPPPPFRLLFMARVVREKGVLECLEATAMLRAQGRDVSLLLAGDGPDMDSVRRAVQRHGLAAHVQLPGYLRGLEKIQALRSSHVFLLASRREGCPVALLEAMASGLAVVTTAVGGIPGIVQNGVNGRILSGATADAITDAVAALMDEPDSVAAMGEANRRDAWARYEAGPVATAFLSLYHRMPAST